ncbi:MAG TPA: Gfo/Idh/MocA family oxidoreductase, partial [Gemmataceae bacterium]|nr:Gfo/Idh/MocA family oxidoreductase [Gemmataceae bacterium]
MATPLRIGLIGAGANTRSRHIPGLQALADVTVVAVCNRRPESTEAVAHEFHIPRRYAHWEEVIADRDVDAVVIGTWPYLHCPITLAALAAGKHVLTEARMSMNADEARAMLQAAREHPKLVAQIVPSPFGLKGHEVMRSLIAGGFLGELREVHVRGLNAALADAATPLSWRQDANLSGFNMLTLGIVQETLSRWIAAPVRVQAQVHAHIPSRIDPQSGVRRQVGTPDSVQVLATLADGARASYHFSGATTFGQAMSIQLYGTQGALQYDLLHDRIQGSNQRMNKKGDELEEISIPADQARSWRVEADFVDAIRLGTPVTLTDFASGVAYMEFTEAVARSAAEGTAVE